MPSSVIDVHSHPMFDEYVRVAAGGESRELDGAPLAPWSAAEHLEVMEAHGITANVLSVSELADVLEGPAGAATARRLNERLAALVSDHPSRFAAVAVVPMDDVDAANTEMAYALDELGLDGVAAAPHRHGVYLGEAAYDPWFDEMDRRGVTLFVHPGRPAYFDDQTSRMNVSVLEFMFETTRMVTSLVLSGTATRYGHVKIIAPHGGGTIPYLAHRISIISQMPWAFKDGVSLSIEEVTEALGQFYYDLTASTSTAQLQALLSVIGPQQLVMGFDYPMMPPGMIDPAIDAFEAYPGITEHDRDAIRRGNAQKLFPRLSR